MIYEADCALYEGKRRDAIASFYIMIKQRLCIYKKSRCFIMEGGQNVTIAMSKALKKTSFYRALPLFLSWCKNLPQTLFHCTIIVKTCCLYTSSDKIKKKALRGLE